MAKKKTNAVTIKKEELLWYGAQRLMKEAVTPKEKAEKSLVTTTARVLNVSPFGINILGNLPYINKLGLGQKAKQYSTNLKLLYKWVKIAKDDAEKAICKCKVKDGDKELTDWILGECSPATMNMSTLKGYQNHMAQTRARNRAILEAFGTKIHEEMIENLEKLYRKGKGEQVVGILGAGGAATVSAEEMNEKNAPKARPPVYQQKTNSTSVGKVKELKDNLPGKTDKQKLDHLNKKTGLKINNFSHVSVKQATMALAALLNSEAK